MYIKNFFKNGKPKKYKNVIKSVKDLMIMFESMNNGKAFPLHEVKSNFNRREIVWASGKRKNLWTVMKDNGFYVELPF